MTPSSSDGGLAALEELRATIGPRFDIKGELGRGTGGIVYLAYDLERKETVALKVLRDHLDPVGIARFRREIEIGTKLRHARIVSLLDSGVVGNRPYYVMQRILGPSLKDRLSDERQLAMQDVFAIAAQAAEALDHAHANQVVHRDIKPANILLGANGAVVADFGIAQLRRAPGDSLTESGLSIGTPQYMSPEQAAGQHTIDGRADIYGLACVVYEMIGGQPPFTGATSQAVMAQHMNEKPRSLRVVRPRISLAADAAIMKALAKVPADRFATAGEFAEALARPDSRLSGAVHRVGAVTRARKARIAIATIAVAGVFAASRNERLMERVGLVPVRLDSTVVAAMIVDSTAPSGLEAADPILDELAGWRGITAASGFALNDALRSSAAQGLSLADRARHASESVRAARFAVVTVMPDSGVLITLRRTRDDSLLAQARVRPRVAASVAVDSLLFRSDYPRYSRPEAGPGTSVIAARRAYFHAQAAIERGEFRVADSLLFLALREDPDYPQALLSQATVRWWLRIPDAPWAPLVAQAVRANQLRQSLAPFDSTMLAALVASASSDAGRACALWRARVAGVPHDFAAWYSLGNCLRRDSLVVRDSRSESGWRFRSSYEESIRAYERAFELRPSLMKGPGANALSHLQTVFSTGSSRILSGSAAAPDSTRFVAYPSWEGDTLTFRPYPRQPGVPSAALKGVSLATQRERQRFHAAVRAWRANAPDQLEAVEGVATALELLGNSTAIDTLRMARSLPEGRPHAVRLGTLEALLQVKFSAPDDTLGLSRAKQLADSILLIPAAPGPAAGAAAALAALTGRAALAARLARLSSLEDVNPTLAQTAPALLAFSALGGPRDSVLSLERRLIAEIASLPPEQHRAERTAWLSRPAMLAFPTATLESTGDRSLGGGLPLIAAAAAGAADSVHAILARRQVARTGGAPGDVMFDGLLSEANALHSVGDARAAASWLDPGLSALRTSAARDLSQFPKTASLVRAMSLRAELAAKLGDRTQQRRWGNAVAILWRDADPFLQPLVRQMQSTRR